MGYLLHTIAGALADRFGAQTVIVAFASFLVWFWLIARYPATRLSSFRRRLSTSKWASL